MEKNIVTIALYVLYATKEKIYPTYVSKNNSNCEKLMKRLWKICLIISNGKKWHYLAVKLRGMLRGIT